MFKNKLTKNNTTIITILIGIFAIQNICFSAGLTNPLGDVTVPGLIGKIIKAVLGIVGSLSLLMFIFGGLTWMTSGGNEEKIKKGKQILVNAALGIIVIFSSYSILNWIFTVLKS